MAAPSLDELGAALEVVELSVPRQLLDRMDLGDDLLAVYGELLRHRLGTAPGAVLLEATPDAGSLLCSDLRLARDLGLTHAVVRSGAPAPATENLAALIAELDVCRAAPGAVPVRVNHATRLVGYALDVLDRLLPKL